MTELMLQRSRRTSVAHSVMPSEKTVAGDLLSEARLQRVECVSLPRVMAVSELSPRLSHSTESYLWGRAASQ